MHSLLEKKQGFTVCRQIVVNNQSHTDPRIHKLPLHARGNEYFPCVFQYNYQHVRDVRVATQADQSQTGVLIRAIGG
jgi:hypothetical protein